MRDCQVLLISNSCSVVPLKIQLAMEAYKYKRAHYNSNTSGSISDIIENAANSSIPGPVKHVDFAELDANFKNLEKVSDDEFVYRASNVLVQSTWELPIVVQYPGTTIKFEFTTTMGDILFGIMFVAALVDGEEEDDMRAETVDEMGRVLSHEEAYGGSFTPRCEGVVFFVWDNSHDWYSHKTVSYEIRLAQPSFSWIDADRVSRCTELLPVQAQLHEAAAIARADCEDREDSCLRKLPLVERKLRQLQTKLKELQDELAETRATKQRLSGDLQTHASDILGLGIRCLNKRCLSNVLSFLFCTGPYGGGGRQSVLTVCKYWFRLCEDLRDSDRLLIRSQAVGKQKKNHSTKSLSNGGTPVRTLPSYSSDNDDANLNLTGTSIAATAGGTDSSGSSASASASSSTGSGVDRPKDLLDTSLLTFQNEAGGSDVLPAAGDQFGSQPLSPLQSQSRSRSRSRHTPAAPLTEQALFKSTLKQKTLTRQQLRVTQQKMADFKQYQRDRQQQQKQNKTKDCVGADANNAHRLSEERDQDKDRHKNNEEPSPGKRQSPHLPGPLETEMEGAIAALIDTLDDDLAIQQPLAAESGAVTGALVPVPPVVSVTYTRTKLRDAVDVAGMEEFDSNHTELSNDVSMSAEVLTPAQLRRHAPGSVSGVGGVAGFLASRSKKEVDAWLGLMQREQARLRRQTHARKRTRKALWVWATEYQRVHAPVETVTSQKIPTLGNKSVVPMTLSKDLLRREAGALYASFETAAREALQTERYIDSCLATAALSKVEYEQLVYQRQNQNQNQNQS